MTVEVTVHESIENVNQNQWNQVVEECELGTVYHRYEWIRAIELGTPDESKHVVARKDSNPVGIFPNFVSQLATTPFSQLESVKEGPAGPLALADEETTIELLLDAISNEGNQLLVSNLIQTYDPGYLKYHDLFYENGYSRRTTYCNLVLDISRSWTDVLQNMHSSRRRPIRNACEAEFTVRDEPLTDRVLDSFFSNYKAVMDRHDTSPIPRSFFDALWSVCGRVKLFSLMADGEESGMILLLLDDEQSTVHFEQSAITEADFDRNASELLHRHAIRWSIENGYTTYDFGGTNVDFRDSLFRFKRRFGARPVPALAWERGMSLLSWPLFGLGRPVYRRFFSY